jgi:hypothetical protein
MSTSADQVMRVLDRYFEVAADAIEDVRQVEAAARRASVDPEFQEALAQVLEVDRTCPQRGSMSACTRVKDYDDAGIDLIIRLPEDTGYCTEQVYALQAKITEIAGPDLRIQTHLAKLLAAAIHLERSSFGTKEARILRSETSSADIVAVRDAWTQLTAVDVPPALPVDEYLQETRIGRDRSKLAIALGRRYDSGESIRSLAASTGRSYGFVYRILTETGVTLRGRGGATRNGKNNKARPGSTRSK